MTNLECHKDKFIEMMVSENINFCDYFHELDKLDGCYSCPCNDKCSPNCNASKFCDWLLEEHKEPIKLTKFEYDLLEYYTYVDNSWNGRILHENYAIRYMCDKGYLKNVDLNMTFREVLDNCEVVEDE